MSEQDAAIKAWAEKCISGKDRDYNVKCAEAILRAHAKQVRKDNPVTDRCPECGLFQIGGLDRFCPDCGLPLTEEP